MSSSNCIIYLIDYNFLMWVLWFLLTIVHWSYCFVNSIFFLVLASFILIFGYIISVTLLYCQSTQTETHSDEQALHNPTTQVRERSTQTISNFTNAYKIHYRWGRKPDAMENMYNRTKPVQQRQTRIQNSI